MGSDLRDRRRRQTAGEIQQAALRLALQSGYASLTTEAIAAEAGISTRTFFNYYPNKQGAILGEPPCLDVSEADWFTRSRGPLLDDLATLLGGLVCAGRLDRDKIRMIREVLAASPELEPLFHDMLEGNTRVLTCLLAARFGPGAEIEAELVATLATSALTHTVGEWSGTDDMPPESIPDLLRGRLQQVCERLSK